jgi:hypothetical protein
VSTEQPYGVTIYCDDIRQEMGNKPSYMGVYTGQLIVQAEEPVLLPKLCAAVHLMIPTYMRFQKLALIMTQEKGGVTNELTRIDMTDLTFAEHPTPGTFSKMHFNLQISPFLVDGPSTLRMRAYIDEETEIKLGTLSAFMQPPPVSETQT